MFSKIQSFLRPRKLLISILILIFAVGFFLRFYKLSSYPVGFHVDEASKGYNAYSILKTGKDDNNHRFSLYVDIFGDNSPSGYHNIAVIPVALFGLTEFAVRLPGALFGSFSIIAIFFLAYAMFENRKIGVLSALLLAIAPWHINLSRASSEGIIALFFIILGFALVLWSMKTQIIKHIIFGTSLLCVSFFFYQTPRVFVPLLYLVFVVLFFLRQKTKLSNRYKKALIFSLGALFLLDFVLIFAVSGGTGRFSQVSIFNHPETRLVMEEQTREDGISGVSAFIARMFHNKGSSFLLTYLSNYFEYFSLNFLFLKDLPQWYFVPGMGVMYLVEMPFVILGAGLLTFHKKKRYLLPLLWLLIAPAVAAITVDIHNVQRALVMFPALEIIASYGLIFLFTEGFKRRKSALIFVITLLFICNIIYFLHQYFIHSKVHRPWYRNSGFSQMMEFVNKDYGNYDNVIATKEGGGYPLFQFYSKYDPAKYQAEGSPKDSDYKGFGKFIFVSEACPFISANRSIPRKGRLIFIEDGKCIENKTLYKAKFKYVLRGDGTKAFRIVYVTDDKIFNNPEYQGLFQ